MKLKYKILWIEDDYKAIRRDKNKIIEYIEDLGFKCIDEEDIILINSIAKFENDIGYGNTADYDLLLIDLDLKEKGTQDEGEYIIRKIRSEKVYSEIIFYSSNYETLTNKLNGNFVEGIFTSTRDELVEKVEKVIYLTLKKVQDINNLRGLIMAEVADLDILKEEIINLASQKVQNKELEKYALDKIKKSGTSTKNKAEENLKQIDTVEFTKLFENIGFIDSNKKALIVGESLDKLEIKDPIKKDDFTQSYIDTILKIRNKFAHIKESDDTDKDGKPCKKIGDIPFTETKCIEIRKEISKYKDILLKIKEKIESK